MAATSWHPSPAPRPPVASTYFIPLVWNNSHRMDPILLGHSCRALFDHVPCCYAISNNIPPGIGDPPQVDPPYACDPPAAHSALPLDPASLHSPAAVTPQHRSYPVPSTSPRPSPKCHVPCQHIFPFVARSSASSSSSSFHPHDRKAPGRPWARMMPIGSTSAMPPTKA